MRLIKISYTEKKKLWIKFSCYTRWCEGRQDQFDYRILQTFFSRRSKTWQEPQRSRDKNARNFSATSRTARRLRRDVQKTDVEPKGVACRHVFTRVFSSLFIFSFSLSPVHISLLFFLALWLFFILPTPFPFVSFSFPAGLCNSAGKRGGYLRRGMPLIGRK